MPPRTFFQWVQRYRESGISIARRRKTWPEADRGITQKMMQGRKMKKTRVGLLLPSKSIVSQNVASGGLFWGLRSAEGVSRGAETILFFRQLAGSRQPNEPVSSRKNRFPAPPPKRVACDPFLTTTQRGRAWKARTTQIDACLRMQALGGWKASRGRGPGPAGPQDPGLAYKSACYISSGHVCCD